MQLIRKVVLCFVVTLCLPVMLVGYELPSVAPEEVGLSVEKLQSVPEAMQKLVDEKRIAAGGGHSLALRSDGSIVGWGDNEYGQATLPAGNDFVAIATGWDYSLAIRRGLRVVIKALTQTCHMQLILLFWQYGCTKKPSDKPLQSSCLRL